MVKNTSGGNKSKNISRKRINESAQQKAFLQKSGDLDLEQYAQVTKVNGSGRFEVLCHDGITRTCHIGGKFRGRNKRDNNVVLNSWLLVGLRKYSDSEPTASVRICDLLCVYDDSDKEQLRNQCPALSVTWRIFTDNDNRMSREGKELAAVPEEGDEFVFMDEATYELDRKTKAATAASDTTIIQMDGEIIDVDDI